MTPDQRRRDVVKRLVDPDHRAAKTKIFAQLIFDGRKVTDPEETVSLEERSPDNGDLFDETDGLHRRLEVKHRLVVFGPDLPDKWIEEGVFIVNCGTWHSAHPKPYTFYLVNLQMTGFLEVDCATFPRWRKELITVPDRDQREWKWIAPAECCRWRWFDVD